MEDRYTIDTPENIEFAYDLAGIGSRFLAAIIDTLLLVVLQIVLGLAILLLLQLDNGLGGATSSTQSVLLAIWGLLAFGFIWGYYITFEMLWNGQSPGKRLIGLRVVLSGGRPITFVASAIRNLIRLIDFLPSMYGVGVLTMFIDARARRLGDLAAGTLVVKEQRSLTLDSLSSSSALPPPLRPGEAPIPTTLPNVHLLTAHDYELVQEFLLRRSELGRDSRAQIAERLAQGLKQRLELPAGGHPELFLEHVSHEYRLREQLAQVTR